MRAVVSVAIFECIVEFLCDEARSCCCSDLTSLTSLDVVSILSLTSLEYCGALVHMLDKFKCPTSNNALRLLRRTRVNGRCCFETAFDAIDFYALRTGCRITSSWLTGHEFGIKVMGYIISCTLSCYISSADEYLSSLLILAVFYVLSHCWVYCCSLPLRPLILLEFFSRPSAAISMNR